MAKSNRELIADELVGVLDDLSAQHRQIREQDQSLRDLRDRADETRRHAQSLRMALYALDGEHDMTIDDADAANSRALEGGQ